MAARKGKGQELSVQQPVPQSSSRPKKLGVKQGVSLGGGKSKYAQKVLQRGTAPKVGGREAQIQHLMSKGASRLDATNEIILKEEASKRQQEVSARRRDIDTPWYLR